MTVDFTTALKDFFEFYRIRDNELKCYILAQIFEDINYHGVAKFFYDKCKHTTEMAGYRHLIGKAQYLKDYIAPYDELTELEDELMSLGCKFGYENLIEDHSRIDMSAQAYEVIIYLSKQGEQLSTGRIAVGIARIRGLGPEVMENDEDTAKYYENTFLTK